MFHLLKVYLTSAPVLGYPDFSHPFDLEVCEELEEIINGEELPIESKVVIQEKHNKPAKQEMEPHSNVVEVLSKVSQSEVKILSKLTLPLVKM